MKLQLSLDKVDLDEALLILDEVKNSIDIIEVGTPFALRCGIKAISLIKKKYPDKVLLADFKIMDGGFFETRLAVSAGADIVTVLGVANDATICGAVSAANEFQKQIMVDLMEVKDFNSRIPVLENLGAAYMCVHTAMDVQSTLNTPLSELKLAKRIVKSAGVAVAGGINLRNIEEIVAYRPEIVIVGAGITSEPDRKKAAVDLRKKLIELTYEQNF